MQGGDGNFYVGGGDEGGGRAPPRGDVRRGRLLPLPGVAGGVPQVPDGDAPVVRRVQAEEKDREGKLAAAAEQAERETLAFRKQLAADRERRLAAGARTGSGSSPAR